MNNMRLPKISYHDPKSVEELIQIKGELKESCAILAGGTDLIPMLKRRTASAKHLVNIKRIPEFKEVAYDDTKGLRIGAAVTLRDIIDHPAVSRFYPLLAQAAQSVGFNQLRNMATLVGNVCLDNKCTFFNQSAFWWKSRPNCFKRGGDTCYVVKGGNGCFALSAADTVSALICLDAELVIRGPGRERRVPVEEFYTGDGHQPHQLEGNEAVTEILIPPNGQGWRSGFLKKSARGSVDFAIANLSLRLKMKGQTVEVGRIALNGVTTKPIRARKAEAWIIGKKIVEATIQETLQLILKAVTPISHVGASAFLRRNVIGTIWAEGMERFEEK